MHETRKSPPLGADPEHLLGQLHCLCPLCASELERKGLPSSPSTLTPQETKRRGEMREEWLVFPMCNARRAEGKGTEAPDPRHPAVWPRTVLH